MITKRLTIGLCIAALATFAVFQGAAILNHRPIPTAKPQSSPATQPAAPPTAALAATLAATGPPPRQIVATMPPATTLRRTATRAQIFGEKPLADYIPGDHLTMHLSPTHQLPLVITAAGSTDSASGTSSLAARIEGVPLGRVAISTLGEAIYVSINGAELGNFEIRRIPSTHELEVKRITAADDLRCASEDHPTLADTLADSLADTLADADTDADAPSSNPPDPARTATKALAGATTIDVAVFFNDQARVVLGGAPGNPADDADIRVKIATAITDANSAMVDSNVPTSFRAVFVAPIAYPYPPAETLDRALNEVRSTTDGAIDQIHPLRDASHADIVSLWIENDVAGGKANVNLPSNVGLKNAFNVIRAQNPTSTFVHEVGHNHGCRHLRSDYTTTPSAYFPDSFAHLLTTINGSRYVTVVASSSDASNNAATRILRLSAPELSYLGTPTGVTNDTNNAATFRAVGPLIANFRGGPDIAPPSVDLKTKSRIKTRRARLTIRGTATDDVAVARVVYRATGQRGLKTAQGASQWKLKIRLKKRRTVIKVFAFDTANNRSNPAKVKLIRVKR
jgi:hypothetical protein